MQSRRQSIDRIRHFNRSYIPTMRLLDRSYLDTGMSMLETAVLIEIGERGSCSANDLVRQFNVDKGYLSRIIGRFVEAGLVCRSTSPKDARVRILALTEKGRAHLSELADQGAAIVDNAFSDTSDAQLAKIADAMAFILENLQKRD